jgi:hypothetical protein
LVLIFASVASGDDRWWVVGTTTSNNNGSQGITEGHLLCADEFPGSVWCTSKMIIEGGIHPATASAPFMGGLFTPSWINPAPVGAASVAGELLVIDFSGIQAHADNLNCQQWKTNSNSATGLVIAATGPQISFNVRECDRFAQYACCAPARITLKPINPNSLLKLKDVR